MFKLLLLLAQALPWQTQPTAEPVVYTAPAQVTVTHGKSQMVDLHFRVRDGLHINSHTPRDKDLIRTELIVAEPAGLDVEAVDFPPGVDFASKAFPNEKLSVYTGELVLHMRVLATKPGEQHLQGVLRYQACDADTCFPPKNAAVALEIVAH